MKEVKLSRKNRMISGVCGGIGEAYDIDPNLVRLAWIAFTLLTYVILGVALYIIAAVIIPEQDKDDDVIEAEYQVKD
ncbi:hypothetical protein AZH53_01305 [Methanomicrobiaceae archaeon CYW5]|uniref:PspC domain-containing protein n=1 Tax=Methanovulcanius yangii TaxID=1789227 RepID=UPI0029CA0734|nr:PspC domain-containing protein [Methanovulcanius yangii]MBT8507066.1 hypothetical protein [Methanovulcanius yangii]